MYVATVAGTVVKLDRPGGGEYPVLGIGGSARVGQHVAHTVRVTWERRGNVDHGRLVGGGGEAPYFVDSQRVAGHVLDPGGAALEGGGVDLTNLKVGRRVKGGRVARPVVSDRAGKRGGAALLDQGERGGSDRGRVHSLGEGAGYHAREGDIGS